jgi:hypothetical protein
VRHKRDIQIDKPRLPPAQYARSGLLRPTARGYLGENIPRPLAHRACDIEVGRDADGARGECRDQDAALTRRSDNCRSIGSALAQPENNDVGLHRREIQIDRWKPNQALRDQPRVSMILRKAREIVIQRKQPRSSDNASLTQRTAEHAPRARRREDRLGRPCEDTANGAAKPLGQCDRYKVEGCRQMLQSQPGRHGRRFRGCL